MLTEGTRILQLTKTVAAHITKEHLTSSTNVLMQSKNPWMSLMRDQSVLGSPYERLWSLKTRISVREDLTLDLLKPIKIEFPRFKSKDPSCLDLQGESVLKFLPQSNPSKDHYDLFPHGGGLGVVPRCRWIKLIHKLGAFRKSLTNPIWINGLRWSNRNIYKIEANVGSIQGAIQGSFQPCQRIFKEAQVELLLKWLKRWSLATQ